MISIAGAGCALMDRLFTGVDFASPAFARYRSVKDGDGGLCPGKLVFVADAEVFSGQCFTEMLESIVPGGRATAENIGGPSLVAMIHATQMLDPAAFSVSYHGARGDDATGSRLWSLLEAVGRFAPLDCSGYQKRPGATPSTFVLSDPSWDGGHGERCFVNDIGVAAGFSAADLGEAFWNADIAVLGGTGLVPRLHDDLSWLLPALRKRGRFTVVNTVFDFRNERRDPAGPWPLGAPGTSVAAFAATNLLIMDREEALRLSGASTLQGAVTMLEACGVGAFVISQGSGEVLLQASGARFAPQSLVRMPVSESARLGLLSGAGRKGDTTGCGDAFAGGIVASIAQQMAAGGDGRIDLRAAVAWGIAGGGATLGIVGGTWYETHPGEKRAVVEGLHAEYRIQTGRGLP